MYRQYTNVKNHRQCIAYKVTLINREKARKLRQIGINTKEVLAVMKTFLYAMRWRLNVNDALSARNYDPITSVSPTLDSVELDLAREKIGGVWQPVKTGTFTIQLRQP